MGRILGLLVGAFVAWRFLARRSRPDETVTLGWTDGSSAVLEPGSPERDRLVALASAVVEP